jgi:hypothetical protein
MDRRQTVSWAIALAATTIVVTGCSSNSAGGGIGDSGSVSGTGQSGGTSAIVFPTISGNGGDWTTNPLCLTSAQMDSLTGANWVNATASSDGDPNGFQSIPTESDGCNFVDVNIAGPNARNASLESPAGSGAPDLMAGAAQDRSSGWNASAQAAPALGPGAEIQYEFDPSKGGFGNCRILVPMYDDVPMVNDDGTTTENLEWVEVQYSEAGTSSSASDLCATDLKILQASASQNKPAATPTD